MISGTNTDSGSAFSPPTFKGIEGFVVHTDGEFFKAIMTSRIFKTEAELALMRHVSIVSSEAHMAVMQQ